MLARERVQVIPAKDYGEIMVGRLLPPTSWLLPPAPFLLLPSSCFLSPAPYIAATPQPNHERNPLEELAALADEEGGQEERRGSRMEVNTGKKGSKFSLWPFNICSNWIRCVQRSGGGRLG